MVDGHLPVFMDMTKGKEHEINWARTLKLPKGSFVCIDRGFTDYHWYSELTTNAIFFVSRLKITPMSNICSNGLGEKVFALPLTKRSDSKASSNR